MNKEVLITVTGIQTSPENETDTLEITVPGQYHDKSGLGFLLYEEFEEDGSASTRNIVKFRDGYLEVTKRGGSSSHMVFENGKEYNTSYFTAFGELLMHFETASVVVSESPSELRVHADYSIAINGEHTADCSLTIRVVAASSRANS